MINIALLESNACIPKMICDAIKHRHNLSLCCKYCRNV